MAPSNDSMYFLLFRDQRSIKFLLSLKLKIIIDCWHWSDITIYLLIGETEHCTNGSEWCVGGGNQRTICIEIMMLTWLKDHPAVFYFWCLPLKVLWMYILRYLFWNNDLCVCNWCLNSLCDASHMQKKEEGKAKPHLFLAIHQQNMVQITAWMGTLPTVQFTEEVFAVQFGGYIQSPSRGGAVASRYCICLTCRKS